MPRVKRGVTARARHKKILALAKGFRGRRKNVYPWCYWYWVNGNVDEETVTADLEAMARAGIGLDRKVLADIAVHDKEAFAAIVDQAKAKLA